MEQWEKPEAMFDLLGYWDEEKIEKGRKERLQIGKKHRQLREENIFRSMFSQKNWPKIKRTGGEKKDWIWSD